MSTGVWIALGVLALIAGVLARRGERRRSTLSDDLVRQVEMTGRIEWDDLEPLDVDEIREKEDEFWAQTWDEPEEM